jgi:ABC-type glycerol-3-phosphate transport system substrate-binding protein
MRTNYTRRRLVGQALGFGSVGAPSLLAACSLWQSSPSRPMSVAHPTTVEIWSHQGPTDENRLEWENVFRTKITANRPHITHAWVGAQDLIPKLLASIAAGTPPDISLIMTAMPELVAKKHLQPAPSRLQKKLLDRWIPAAAEPGVFDGRLHGSINRVQMSHAFLMVETNNAADAGLDPDQPPRTLDDLAIWGMRGARWEANSATDAGLDPSKPPTAFDNPAIWDTRGARWEGDTMQRLGFGIGIQDPGGAMLALLHYAHAFGGRMLDVTETRSELTSSACRSALIYLRDLYQRFRVASASFVPDTEAIVTDRAVSISGPIGFAAYAELQLRGLLPRGPVPDAFTGKLRFRYYPHPRPAGIVTPNWFGVLAKDDRAPLAWEVLETFDDFVASSDRFIGTGNYLPWIRGQRDRGIWRDLEVFRVAIDTAERHGYPLPRTAKLGVLATTIGPLIHQAITQGRDAEATLAEADRLARMVLEQ